MTNRNASGLFVDTSDAQPRPVADVFVDEPLRDDVIDIDVTTEVQEPALTPVDEASSVGISPAAAPKRRWFSRGPKAFTATDKGAKPGKPVKRDKAAKGPVFDVLPVQVLMGYLPEVSERDALEYAMGLSDKYLVQEGISYFAATKYGPGYIYEVHEGGSGKAFGPEIARYFQSVGPFNPQAPEVVYIGTAQRIVEVTRERVGLSAILLPESTEAVPSEWLRPKKAMRPGVPRRKGMLVAGILLLVTGTLAAATTGVYFRLQGYAPAPAQPIERIQVGNLPSQQWDVLMRTQHVKALRYADGAWQAPEVYTEEDLKSQEDAAKPSSEGTQP